MIASGGPAERGLAILADWLSRQSSQNTTTQAEHTVSNIERTSQQVNIKIDKLCKIHLLLT